MKSRMLDDIGFAVTETRGQFQGYQQCIRCERYGDEDEFLIDTDKEWCDECTKEVREDIRNGRIS